MRAYDIHGKLLYIYVVALGHGFRTMASPLLKLCAHKKKHIEFFSVPFLKSTQFTFLSLNNI
jgi:hypothetical protein